MGATPVVECTVEKIEEEEQSSERAEGKKTILNFCYLLLFDIADLTVLL
jgi:hypothetical protein